MITSLLADTLMTLIYNAVAAECTNTSPKQMNYINSCLVSSCIIWLLKQIWHVQRWQVLVIPGMASYYGFESASSAFNNS